MNRDKLRQASLFVIHRIKYNTCGKIIGWIPLNQHLFFHFAVALFVSFPPSKEPPYFTAEPERVILAEVEKDVDILCQAMGECADVFNLGWEVCLYPALQKASQIDF